MKLEKMGMRTIKTGIAVTTCVLIAKYLVENVFFSAIACIVSMQNTVKGSMKAGFNRVKGTIIGGVIGFLIALIKPGDPFLCGIGVMTTIYLCNIFNTKASVVVSAVTFLAIHLGDHAGNPMLYSINRVIDTSVGVVVGVLINYILVRPDYLESTVIEIEKVEKIVKNIMKLKIVNKEKVNIDKLSKQIQKLENIYSRLVEELHYTRSEIDTENIERSMDICREIYFHVQSIELLEKKLYLNKENHKNIRSLYKCDIVGWDINEDESPVFNYHLNKVVQEIIELNKIIKSN
ncbi:aromatic acid exporter family protein [Romboutsia maritimum]|uniref:Aromatic acid exporter family protein n=1 Tax=Romboutsia maritimum TaxID=2020948 RepID=A0A371IVA4_9FIRM|nr:aromatic acid exporter family protein [Romboutsia maritimum]RDY24417.1 aromatic acid exporter family protein [Romboutsia maritimum]